MTVRPMLSGHCSVPQTEHPELSHQRCERNGAGNTHRPGKEFQPCPCGCHLGEEFECANCGRPLREAPLWPSSYDDADVTYVHINPKTGLAVGEECA